MTNSATVVMLGLKRGDNMAYLPPNDGKNDQAPSAWHDEDLSLIGGGGQQKQSVQRVLEAVRRKYEVVTSPKVQNRPRNDQKQKIKPKNLRQAGKIYREQKIEETIQSILKRQDESLDGLRQESNEEGAMDKCLGYVNNAAADAKIQQFITKVEDFFSRIMQKHPSIQYLLMIYFWGCILIILYLWIF